MNIRVLGCSGAEFPGNNLPAFLLDGKILFDAGSLTKVLNEREQFGIKHIFITHAHLDHIVGIPFLADNIIMKKRTHNVNVLSIPPVIKTIKKNLFNSSVWPDFTVIPDPCNAVLFLVEIHDGRPQNVDGYTITPYRVNHSVPAVGYLVEDSSMKRFFYTGDTGPTGKTWRKIGNRQLDCMIIEVSFPNRMREMALMTGHLTPKMLEEELLQLEHMPKRIYITHPKPQHFTIIKRELQRLKIRNMRLLREGEVLRV
jgi:cAMP phosphodiesterase